MNFKHDTKLFMKNWKVLFIMEHEPLRGGGEGGGTTILVKFKLISKRTVVFISGHMAK